MISLASTDCTVYGSAESETNAAPKRFEFIKKMLFLLTLSAPNEHELQNQEEDESGVS